MNFVEIFWKYALMIVDFNLSEKYKFYLKKMKLEADQTFPKIPDDSWIPELIPE